MTSMITFLRIFIITFLGNLNAANLHFFLQTSLVATFLPSILYFCFLDQTIAWLSLFQTPAVPKNITVAQ